MTQSAKEFGAQAAKAAAEFAKRITDVARSAEVHGAAKAIASDVAKVAKPAAVHLNQAIREEWKGSK